MDYSDFLRTPGAHYRNFVTEKVIPIPELQCLLREIVHEPSGALVMHIEADDPENLFCLSFKTLPSNSNGVAHILEHTVLCGSRQYPVKDPFFAMSRRSLNTFMNALTGADFTCYPAASQVEKDFYNLLDVYLDAVFHPQLKEMSFLQEGHRLEFADPEDPHSLLECKGVVYNEMKGSMASPDSRLWHELMAALLPDLPYAHNSGGDPAEIPNLSYAELISFHETYYHPSRCLFFFYGNFPLQKHLDILEEKALKNVLPEPAIPPLPLQRRFTQPVHRIGYYPTSEETKLDRKTMIAFSWLTLPLTEQQELLALSVLDCALMDTDASPLKAILLESGLCIQADSFVDLEMSEVPYAISCKGCRSEDVDALEHHLFQGLKKIAEEGIPRHVIEAAIHQLEFSRTEISGEQTPFGLTLFIRSGLAKQHGCPPENALTLHALFDQLLKDMENPSYFSSLIQRHFIDNSHRVRLVLEPDAQLTAKETEQEKKRLQDLRQQLTDEGVKTILLQAKDLARYQKETEHQLLDCLPKVSLEDVPSLVREFPFVQQKHPSLQIFHHDCFTNHILYADLVFDLPQIAQEDLSLAQLLCSILPELGAGKRTFAENLDYIQAHTGGIGFTLSLNMPAQPNLPPRPSLNLRGKALSRKAPELCALMVDELTSARFDEPHRIAELVAQIHTGLQNRLNRNAARYAIQTALKGLSQWGFIHDAWFGMGYFEAVHQLVLRCEQDLHGVVASLERLYKELFCLQSPHLILSCDEGQIEKLESAGFFGLKNLPIREGSPWKGDYELPSPSCIGKTIASPISFNCEAFRAPHYSHLDAPPLHIATQLFENKTLHHLIREKGGAYGTGSSYSPMMGHLYFQSYRDPHIAATLQHFHLAISQIADSLFTLEDLEEAKLGLIQQFDSPVSPGSRAMVAYSWWREGKTPAMRQHYRDRLLSTTAKEVSEAVRKHLLPQINSGIFVSFAGQDLLEKELPALASQGIQLSMASATPP